MDANDLLLWSLPAFTLLMLLELAVLRAGQRVESRLGYAGVDTRTNVTMGSVFLVVSGAWRYVELLLLGAVAGLTPLHLHGWVAWVVALVGVDLAYYWEHRAGHEVRVLWASHVVHHSSQRYNLSTAVRQTWTGEYTVLFLVPLALLGVPVGIVFLAWSINLLYQFWIHTEAVDRLPRPVEWVFNTPSHHRVHHGSQAQYLDRNYGGVLIVWDRLFRSFEPEGERVVYGLTKNLETTNPLRVATHEYAAIWRDLRGRTWRDRGRTLLRGPGWSPREVDHEVPSAALAGSTLIG